MPNKSSLCRFRQKISFEFFKEHFEELVGTFDPFRKTWCGLKVYAIDGKELTLPASDELREKHYKGRVLSNYRETYTPRMYISHCYDVINEVSKDFRYGPFNGEHFHADRIVRGLEENSLVLYDRLYFSYHLINLHVKSKNYFLMRMRSSGVPAEIKKFFKSEEKRMKWRHKGKELTLIKVSKPREGFHVYLTNLPARLAKTKYVTQLYKKRWEVENSFRELTETIKLEQFHTKKLNGILQEIYASLWLANFTKIQMFQARRPRSNLADTYIKLNFKFALNWISEKIKMIFETPKILKELHSVIKRTGEKRMRYKRSYPRVIKSPASPYKYDNTVWVINGKLA